MAGKKYQGFKLQNGRDPIPGKDYDPGTVLQQDEYEYLTGTGRYTNDPKKVMPAKDQAFIEMLEACRATLVSLEIFSREVIKNDMIVPIWCSNSIDQLKAAISQAEKAQS